MITLYKKELCEIVKNNVGYADGNGVVFAIKYYYKQILPRIPGSEIWLKIIKEYPKKIPINRKNGKCFSFGNSSR